MTELEPEILERARRGDRDAHAALYRAYAPMVFTVARRILGSTALAEDALQDSFVEVIRKADQFRGASGVGHWIRQIAINKCLSELRSPWMRKRVEVSEDPDRRTGDAGETPGHELGLDRLTAQHTELERALDALSRTARAVVWLHDVEGYTHEEIGRLMGRTTSFSKSQLARAYRDLRNALQPKEADEETEPCLDALKTV